MSLQINTGKSRQECCRNECTGESVSVTVHCHCLSGASGRCGSIFQKWLGNIILQMAIYKEDLLNLGISGIPFCYHKKT